MDLNLTAILAGIIISVIYLFLQVKKRAERRKYNFEDLPFGLFIIQVVVILAAVNLFTYWLAEYKGIPVILVVMAVLVVAYSFFTTKTVSGRYIYAMGGNEKAAKLSV